MTRSPRKGGAKHNMINCSSSLLGLKDLIILNIYTLRPHTSLLTFRTHFIVLGATTFATGGTFGSSDDGGGGPLPFGMMTLLFRLKGCRSVIINSV